MCERPDWESARAAYTALRLASVDAQPGSAEPVQETLDDSSRLRPGLDVESDPSDVRSLYAWNPVPVDERVMEGAWVIQDRYGLSWWDALIVAAAQIVDRRFLLTEDLQDGQELGEVRVLNPFVHAPESVIAL
ncbi:MAG: PIN domain-containing protein [Gemmatimonadota bacterium]|nr:MAG: PIN domain-containing protein [Gemmatimonadota bacterium]